MKITKRTPPSAKATAGLAHQTSVPLCLCGEPEKRRNELPHMKITKRTPSSTKPSADPSPSNLCASVPALKIDSHTTRSVGFGRPPKPSSPSPRIWRGGRGVRPRVVQRTAFSSAGVRHLPHVELCAETEIELSHMKITEQTPEPETPNRLHNMKTTKRTPDAKLGTPPKRENYEANSGREATKRTRKAKITKRTPGSENCGTNVTPCGPPLRQLVQELRQKLRLFFSVKRALLVRAFFDHRHQVGAE